MKFICSIIILTSLISSSAFAISNDELADFCLEVGQQKVLTQAKAYGCKVDIEDIEVNDIDNRWYNPSKYIWYQAMGECNGYDRIIKLVQYSKGECF